MSVLFLKQNIANSTKDYRSLWLISPFHLRCYAYKKFLSSNLPNCFLPFCIQSKTKQTTSSHPHPTQNNHTKKHKSPQQNQTKTKHKKHTKIIILSTNFCQHNLKYMWMISYPCNQTFIINLEDRCILKGRDTVFESKI